MTTARILQGDALTRLRELPSGSVHCIVTSPPYYGLRKYLPDGHADKRFELGNERVPDCLGWATGHPCGACYVCRLLAVFAECWRVLRDDGVMFLNLGDSYANDGKWGGSTGGKHVSALHGEPIGRTRRETGLKPKDLIGVPWRVAFALQAAGWWLRADIIWAKKAPMPESVTDRPTRSHEHVFLLTKSARYFYDAEAVKEQSTGQNGTAANFKRETKDGGRTETGKAATQHRLDREPTFDNGSRNQRDVWLLGPEPYAAAHFATFPTEIPRRAILAGTSERGCCPACGAPWERIIENSGTGPQRQSRKNEQVRLTRFAGQAWEKWKAENPNVTTGWAPTCRCYQLTCANRCFVIDYNHDTTKHHMRLLRELIPAGQTGAEVLLSDLLRGISEEGARQDLSDLWQGIQAEIKSAMALQQNVRSDLYGTQSAQFQGLLSDNERVHSHLQAGSSDGVGNGICDGASACDGADDWPIASAVGGCSPHQRGEERQSPRKLGTAREGTARLNEDPCLHGDVSVLQSHIPCTWECPYCKSPLISKPFAPQPAVILDPFAGSGTTLAVAVGLGRHGIGIELSAEYIKLAQRRINAVAPLLTTVEVS